jgi:hypothetical protein
MPAHEIPRGSVACGIASGTQHLGCHSPGCSCYSHSNILAAQAAAANPRVQLPRKEKRRLHPQPPGTWVKETALFAAEAAQGAAAILTARLPNCCGPQAITGWLWVAGENRQMLNEAEQEGEWSSLTDHSCCVTLRLRQQSVNPRSTHRACQPLAFKHGRRTRAPTIRARHKAPLVQLVGVSRASGGAGPKP